MQIAECRPFFVGELRTSSSSELLLRQSRLRAITYSNQIEGNTLSEREVEKLLKADSKEQPDREELEVLNYEAALNFADRLAGDSRQLSIKDFCDLQSLITKSLISPNQSGRIRTVQASIGNPSTGIVLDTCPEPYELDALMEDLWLWLRDTEGENSFARAFAFHQIAIVIHPFADGNGRTVRLFQNLLLLRSGEVLARYIPSESALMKARDRYYLTIRESKARESLTPMLEFLAECFAKAASETTNEARNFFERTKKSKRKPAPVRKSEILNFARKHSGFKLSELSTQFPEAKTRTLQRDLDALSSEGMLRSEGKLKGTRYYLVESQKQKSKSKPVSRKNAAKSKSKRS